MPFTDVHACGSNPSQVPEHPDVAKLIRDPSAPDAAVQFVGYPGQSLDQTAVRLYLSLGDLSAFLEIPRDAIVHVAPGPASLPNEAATLWVKRDALVRHCTTITNADSAQRIASRLKGSRKLVLNRETMRSMGIPTGLPMSPGDDCTDNSLLVCSNPCWTGHSVCQFCDPTLQMTCRLRGCQDTDSCRNCT